jgi:hypothetical protein
MATVTRQDVGVKTDAMSVVVAGLFLLNVMNSKYPALATVAAKSVDAAARMIERGNARESIDTFISMAATGLRAVEEKLAEGQTDVIVEFMPNYRIWFAADGQTFKTSDPKTGQIAGIDVDGLLGRAVPVTGGNGTIH